MLNARALFTGFAIATSISGCIQSPFDEDDGPQRPTPFDERDSGEMPSFPVDGGFRPPPPARLSLIVADRPPPPISGGTLAVTSDGVLAVAADPDRDAVYVVKLADATSTTVSLPQGSEPGRTVLDGSGFAHVILRSADAVARISLSEPAVAQQTSVCQHPRGVAYDAASDAIWVACANGELVSLAAKTHAELTRSFVALDLRDVIITKSGERFVSRYRSAELLHVRADGSVMTTTTPRKTGSFSVQGLSVTNSPTLAWRTVTSVDGNPLMLHQQAQDDEVLIQPGGYGGGCATITQPSVTRYDELGQPTMTATFGSPALAVDVAMSPDGKSLAVATPGAYLQGQRGSLQVISLNALEVSADAGVPQPLPSADAGVPPPSVDAGVPPPVTDGGRVLADAATPRFDAGFPRSPTPSRGFGCIPGWSTGNDVQATAVVFDADGRLYVLSREPAQLTVYEFSTISQVYVSVATIPLDARSVRDTGHELFHADVGSGLACASCHGEATDDGHVWTFSGFGPRRTQHMRGGMLSTLPLHWEGDMPTFKHLVDDVMTGRMGGFTVEQKYADALAGWIDAQPELKLKGADPAASQRGKALFDSAEVACSTCHSGAQLTNNKSADVGTGGLFQVPSLLGLALRGPFMHDGCAKTLHERFEPSCGGGDRHGKTSQLTPAQLSDLVAYLQGL